MASRTTQEQKFGTRMSHVTSTPGFLFAAHMAKAGSAQVRPEACSSFLFLPQGSTKVSAGKIKATDRAGEKTELVKDLLFDP